jgi:two-component system phosphate regulon response regulator PhoB
VITDVQMPFMNGLEFAQSLHKNKATTHIPVVVLTARGHTLATSDTDIPNVKKVISKPFSPRGIVELVEELLKDTPVTTTNTSEAA